MNVHNIEKGKKYIYDIILYNIITIMQMINKIYMCNTTIYFHTKTIAYM